MPMVTCPIDGTPFHIAPSILRRRKHPPTCSPSCRAQQMRGQGHWGWKGGRYIDAEGYVRVRQNGAYVYEHHLVMERKLRRRLRAGERVLHRDGVPDNNAPGNLKLQTSAPKIRHARRRRRAAA